MKTLRLFALLAAIGLVHAATPLPDVQMSGSSNQVKASSTLTILSGGTLSIASGATFHFVSGSTVTFDVPIPGASGGTGVANTSKTITLGGNLVISGAFGTTLTVTAGTNVTLPITGTLGTLAGSETFTNKTLTAPIINKGIFPEGSAPATPASSTVVIYAKSDGLLYSKDDAGTETPLGGGTGDFVGPGSSTDNAVVRFDGTTGKLGQNSVVTIDDSGNAAGLGTITVAEGSAPSTPASNKVILYAKSDGLLYSKDDAGTETLVSGGSGGGGGSIGGSTGSTDNALMRADGTGGATIQSSSVTLADSSGTFTSSTSIGLTAGGSNQDVTLTPSGTGRVTITQSANASIGPVISNTNGGSSAIAEIQFTNDQGSTYFGLGGSANSTTYIGNYFYLYAPSNAAGIALWWNGIAKYRVNSGGTTLADNVTITGTTSLGGNVISDVTVAGIVRTVKTGADMGLYISGDAGRNRSLYFQTGSNVRGAFYVDDNTETGSGNAGSNFWFTLFNDAGAGLNDAFLIYRNTGHMILGSDYGNYPSDLGGQLQIVGKTSTFSSGVDYSFQILRPYNQTSTAGSTDFLINRAETAIGSGAQLFEDFQVGGSSKYSISRTGDVLGAGSITTGTPSGGTAAAWKFGTVASVSPTAQNRTIELDVAGTRYFLTAKTTND